jgi:5-methylcytosine-specific restriction protein B
MTSVALVSPAQSSAPCWFVGAMTGGADQTNRFIDEGIWEHDFDDNSRVLTQVRTMQTGERIAIKASTRRKAGLIDSTDKTRRAWYS